MMEEFAFARGSAHLARAMRRRLLAMTPQAEPAFHAIGPVVAASAPAKATLVLFGTKCTESMGLSSWFILRIFPQLRWNFPQLRRTIHQKSPLSPKKRQRDFFRSYDGFWDFFYACGGLFYGRKGSEKEKVEP